MMRWEYRAVFVGYVGKKRLRAATDYQSYFDDALNRLGAEGWELVNIVIYPTDGGLANLGTRPIAFLKRPASE